jgi:hypothetical protein
MNALITHLPGMSEILLGTAAMFAQEPTIPSPEPMPLPAPGWLLWFLLMLTFLLHILAMNFVLGGSIISAVVRRRAGSDDRPHHTALFRWLSKAMPVAVAAAISLGVAPLLFVQVLYGRLFFTSSVLMAWFWLSVVPLLILAYLTAYMLSFRGDQSESKGVLSSWIMAALFIAIGFIYSNNMSLMLRPEAFLEIYQTDGSGLNLNLSDPVLFPRYLHMLVAAIGVAGLMVAVVGFIRRRADAEFGDWTMRYGARWFVGATSLNLILGLFFLGAQPRHTLMRFLGQHLGATLLLGFGVFFALGALMMAFTSIHAPEPHRLLRGAAISLVLTLLMMVLMRDQVRRAALDAAGFEPVPWVAPQWGVIGIFLVLLVAAIATIAWMVVALARGRGEEETA